MGVYQRGHIWWIKYRRDGKPIYESSKSRQMADAVRLLRLREGAVAEGKHPGADILRTTVADLLKLFTDDQEANQLKSRDDSKSRAARLDKWFGRLKAGELTTTHLNKYRLMRRQGTDRDADGRTVPAVSDVTVNREFAALRRAYRLGLRHEPPLVARVPHIPFVQENNTRTGFFEHDEFLALRGALPDRLKVALTIGYYTGLRRGEVMGLTWDRVDFDRGEIRLDVGTTKNKKGRVVPLTSDLHDVLTQWRRVTLARFPACRLVIHRDGKKSPETSNYEAWRKACARVGLTGKRFHDLRRSAVRNFVRAGVSQTVSRTISGHKTESVFTRYDITSDKDVKNAGVALDRYTTALAGQAESVAGLQFGLQSAGSENSVAAQPVEKIGAEGGS